MRILQVHKYLYRKAGAEAYVLDLAQLLAGHGHEVALWGTAHNPPTPLPPPLTPPRAGGENPSGRGGNVTISPPFQGGVRGGWDDLLVHHLNFDQREGLWRDLRKVGHMLWSREAAGKFERVLKEFKPDLIHIHNIYHHISPSILPVAARYNIPVVATVHDYHLINPNYTLYDHGEICECQGLRAIVHRCIKNSYAATFADVLEWNVHKWMRVYEKHVAKFLAPTEFVKKKLVENNISPKKIEVIPLMVTPTPPLPPLLTSPRAGEEIASGRGGKIVSPPLGGGVRGGEGYVLFSGRLVVEKGIYLLLEIAKHLPDIQFKIAGTGPEEEKIKNKISKIKNVELLGFVKKKELQQLIAGARLILVPSLWYDPSPLAVLEAMAQGKVVAGSKLGGIAELIQNNKTGFLVSGAEKLLVMQWVDTISKLYYDEELLKHIGAAAAEYIKSAHSPAKHYEKIMKIYRQISN